MQATHDRRHEKVGWRKKRGLYFPLPHTCSPHKMESLLACRFYKVSYKTAIGSLKASIRTQLTTYLCINFYGLTWERILPTLGALRDDTKTAAWVTSTPCISQSHFAAKFRIPALKKTNPESRDSNKENPGSREWNRGNAWNVKVEGGSTFTFRPDLPHIVCTLFMRVRMEKLRDSVNPP